jgi:aldehyde dehydrogenase (NAD+)
MKALVLNALGRGFDPWCRDGLDAGYFVKPTVFVNVKNDMTIAQEEIFGPVLCVIAYDSEEDAIRIANDFEIWSPRRRPRRGPPTRASRGFTNTGRARGDQRHEGRSAGALGRIQILRGWP